MIDTIIHVFVIMIQSRHVFESQFNAFLHLKRYHQRTLRLLFGDCRFNYFHSSMRSAFFVSRGLLCLYDKQNNTWLLVDMEFLFSCSTRHLTRSRCLLMNSPVKRSKRNSISTRACVLCIILYVSSYIQFYANVLNFSAQFIQWCAMTRLELVENGWRISSST